MQELDKFIYDIAGNYNIYTNEYPDLEMLDKERINKIRLTINIIIKIYSNISLTEKEKIILEKYKYDINKDLEKNICYIVAKIDEEYSNNAYLLHIKACNNNMKKIIIDNTWKYITMLRNNYNDLLHSITHNHEISIIDVNDNCVKPKLKSIIRKK